MSGAGMSGSPSYLVFIWLSEAACQRSLRPLQSPHHNLFMLALINSPCICNETHALIEMWKRTTCLIWKGAQSIPTPLVTIRLCTTWTRNEAIECNLHATCAYKPNQVCADGSWDFLNPHVFVHLSKSTWKQIRHAPSRAASQDGEDVFFQNFIFSARGANYRRTPVVLSML